MTSQGYQFPKILFPPSLSSSVQGVAKEKRGQCCQFRGFPAELTSFDEALREIFSSRGLRFFGLFFVIPFGYLGLVFGVTTSV